MLHKHGIETFLTLAAIGLAGLLPLASAAEFAGVAPVSDTQLAHMRGGFSVSRGANRLHLSLGIERLSFVNGELASVTQLGAPKGTGLRLLQNGPGNRFDTSALKSLSSGTLGTAIQNSLDDQTIQNLNVFNVTVTSRRLAQSLAVGDAVRDSLTRVMH